MASIVTQSDQTVEVLTQFWSKMGPKMGPHRGWNQKKVEKYFFSGPTQGVKCPPIEKHDFGKFPVCWTMLVSNFKKKCGFLPELHRFGPECPKCPKMVQKQSTPVFDHFFGKFPVCWTMLATFFGKKCGFVPRRAIRRGRKPHFFSKFDTSIVQQTGNFPKSCFFLGGHLTPCNRGGNKDCAAARHCAALRGIW